MMSFRAISRQPAGHSFEIGSATTKHRLQVALSVANVPREAHSISTSQSRDTAFHATAMLVVILFKGFRLLSLASFLQQGVGQPHAQSAPPFFWHNNARVLLDGLQPK